MPKAMLARSLFYRAVYSKLSVAEPDIPGGISMLERSLALDPSPFCVGLELGNQYLATGDRESAIRAYEASFERAPKTDSIYEQIGSQLERVRTEPLETLQPVRSPCLE